MSHESWEKNIEGVFEHLKNLSGIFEFRIKRESS